jgi:hypothetical protein
MAILVSLSDRKTSTPSWIPTWPVGGEFRIYKKPRSQPTDIEVTIWMQEIPRISESPKATRQQKHQAALTSRIPYKTVLQATGKSLNETKCSFGGSFPQGNIKRSAHPFRPFSRRGGGSFTTSQ